MDRYSIKTSKNWLIRELEGEVVLYDKKDSRCHVLNPTAALVWKHCEKESSVTELAQTIATQTNLPADPTIVYLALQELNDAVHDTHDTSLMTHHLEKIELLIPCLKASQINLYL